ncbi:MAG: haloacid dehalogenase-like hydrolase, partial [Muribaculaceae bacterium]|nr:haloacid dehalogenase-like hydrolase [Muribaculaceae bacterium]
MKSRVIVFDFDGTLTRDDTFISFACHTLGKCSVIRGILMNINHLVGWKLGLLQGSSVKERLYSTLYKGKSKEEIMAASRDFIPRYRKEMMAAVKRHIEMGDKVYIITASLDLWMTEIAEKLKVGLICTLTSEDSAGRLDGRFSTPNCHGEEKVRRLLDKEGDRSEFYLMVYGNEPEDGDSSLFKIADKG